MDTAIQFQVKEKEKYHILTIELNCPIEPEELKTIKPPLLYGTKGVILYGRSPIWLYCYLTHYYHIMKFIATYDPRVGGAVIVESHTKEYEAGDIIVMEDY